MKKTIDKSIKKRKPKKPKLDQISESYGFTEELKQSPSENAVASNQDNAGFIHRKEIPGLTVMTMDASSKLDKTFDNTVIRNPRYLQCIHECKAK